MHISRRSLTRLIAVAAVLLAATPAFAGTMLFAEVLTSSQSMFLPQNVRATLEAGYIDGDPEDIMMQGAITPGAGIGDGHLTHIGDYALFTHRFTPSQAYTDVLSASLMVAVRDDAFTEGGMRDAFTKRERVDIKLNGSDEVWNGGRAWLRLFNGDVTALFANHEDEMTVAVIARRDTTIVDFSSVVWTYEIADLAKPATAAAAVPEPTGLALFCVGAVVLRRATRRAA